MLCNAMAAAAIDLVDYKSRAVVQSETYCHSADGPCFGKSGIDDASPKNHIGCEIRLMMLLSELSSSGS